MVTIETMESAGKWKSVRIPGDQVDVACTSSSPDAQ